MNEKKLTKFTVQVIIGLFVYIAVINLVPFEIIRSRRSVHTALAGGLIVWSIINYVISRKIKISWNEPKAICRARGKEKLISELRNTSWLRVSVYMLVLVPLFIRLPWFFLPVIFLVVILIAVLHVIVIYYYGSSRIDVFEDGIRLWDSDRRLRKYLYSKMSAIEMASTRQGDILLQWYYEGNQIIRGISKEINIAELKALIERNSRQTVKTTEP